MNTSWAAIIDAKLLNSGAGVINDLPETAEAIAIIPLIEHVIITVEGPDTIKFLQGQCTADVTQLINQEWRLSAHCNAKGRMISSFAMALLGSDCVGLRVHKSIANKALQALQKYIVFSKATCQLSQILAFGITGQLPVQIIRHSGHTGSVSVLADAVETSPSGPNRLLLCHNKTLHELWMLPGQLSHEPWLFNYPWHSVNTWCRLMIEQGLAEVQAATSESHVPQAFNYDLVGAVNFKKGCYTGQEIIARLHYKGQSKTRVYGATIPTSATEMTSLTVGLKVGNSAGKTLGEVVAVGPGPETTQLLICTSADPAGAEDLYLEETPVHAIRAVDNNVLDNNVLDNNVLNNNSLDINGLAAPLPTDQLTTAPIYGKKLTPLKPLIFPYAIP